MYEVLITHAGYTDTAYALCGGRRCAEVVLESIGVPSKVLAGLDANDPGTLDLGDDTTVEVGMLGESDSCEWCATCGAFIRHGIFYPNDDVGCDHGPEADPRPALPGPHVDLMGAPAMRTYWNLPQLTEGNKG